MLSSLIANIQDAIVLLDVNGNVVFESPSAAAVLGVRPDQVLRAFGMGRIHPEDRAAVVESFERTRAVPGFVFRASYRFQRADGEWRHLEAVAKNLLHDMELEGILVTFRDITERIHSLEMAEAAAAARDEFLSRMSHELRTPLNAIIGWGRLLQDEESEEVREAAEHIVTAGLHLLGVVNDALDTSAVQEGRITMRMTAVALQPIISEIVDLVRPLAAMRGVEVSISWGDTHSATVHADPHRLRQILLNLLSNAVKYGRENGAVCAGVRRRDQGWRLYVSDDGPGIAPHLLGRLFERYDRLGADATEVEGTGLGLAITRRLVELMGGQIGVETAAGRGTTFWIDMLPASKEAHLDSPAEKSQTAEALVGAT